MEQSVAVRFQLNGEPSTVPAGHDVAQVVAALLGDGAVDGVAVAVNDEVVPRSTWGTRPVLDGDRVEVLNAVAGG